MRDSDVKIPLYYQLAQTLSKQIEAEMAANDKLASEKEIGEEYSVSRTTVRLALSELERQGYIYRMQGKGSYVSQRPAKMTNSLLNLAPQPNTGKTADQRQTKLIEFEHTTPSDKVMQLRNISAQQKITRVSLLTSATQEPLLIDTFLIRTPISTPLSRGYLKVQDPYAALSSLDMDLYAVSETYAITQPTKKEQKLLHIDAQEPLLLATKQYYDSNNRIILLNMRHVVSSCFQYQNFFSND